MAPFPMRRRQSWLRWFKPTLSTWIVGAVVLGLLLIGAQTGGLPAVIAFGGIAGFVTALYVLATGRRSWASIPSRKTAAIVFVVSILIFFSGGIFGAVGAADPVSDDESLVSALQSGTPIPTPTASFTAESPADPTFVVAPDEDAAVVIAETDVTNTTALALLAVVPIKGKAPKTGYDRTAMFGTAWIDVDRNGCDTRNDILARDLTAIAKSGECRILTGNLVSPFTATTIVFARGQDTSALVQIDHVVALSNAWQTGAQQLTQAQRVSLANDPINLLAVDGASNAQKGDGDTATWLPANKSFRCEYVARQVSVKATYGLWVTQAEHDAIARVLTSCADEAAVTSSFAPRPARADTVAPEPSWAPAVEPPLESGPAETAPLSEVYFENCDAVRAAGAAPIYAGTPGYSSKLDRDKDGIGCDT